MNLRIFQWCIVFVVIVKVLSDTESRNVCQDDTDTLKMKIKTGDVLFAGTDLDVSLVLRNDNGVICQVFSLNNYGDDRERNSIDQYTICCPKNFLNGKNELSMLGIVLIGNRGKHSSGFTDDWFMEQIEIYDNQRLLFDYRFHSWVLAPKKLLFGVSKITNTTYTRF